MSNALYQAIQTSISRYLDEIHTSVPARIVDYDPTKQEASVQPMIKRRYYDASGSSNGVVDQPTIVAVPVVFPSAAGGILSFPIKVGDIVLLIFSEQSLDNFLFSGGDSTIDPQDHRRFHYSDAIAIPGLYPLNRAPGSDPDDVVLRFNVGTASENSVKLKPNGDIVITTPGKTIVNSTGNVEITAPTTAITGNLTVSGTIVSGGNITAPDVFAGGKSGKLHTHTTTTTGNPTSSPN
jgi:hypothetical protein